MWCVLHLPGVIRDYTTATGGGAYQKAEES